MQGIFPLREIITHEFPLADTQKAFEIAETGLDRIM